MTEHNTDFEIQCMHCRKALPGEMFIGAMATGVFGADLRVGLGWAWCCQECGESRPDDEQRWAEVRAEGERMAAENLYGPNPSKEG